MKNQVTFSHILAIISILVIPLIVWGVSVEKRLEMPLSNKEEIHYMKSDIKENQKLNQENFDKVLEKLNDIKLNLKDKLDRE